MMQIPEAKSEFHTIRVDGCPRTLQDAEILQFLMSENVFFDPNGLASEKAVEEGTVDVEIQDIYRETFFDLPYNQGEGWTLIELHNDLWNDLKEQGFTGKELQDEHDMFCDNMPLGYLLTEATITYGYSDSMTSIRTLRVFVWDDDPANKKTVKGEKRFHGKYILEAF